MKRLDILSAGAAQPVLGALAERHGYSLVGHFGAVGAMRERLLAGEPCDLLVLSRALIEPFFSEGRVLDLLDLGTVRTGIAVRANDPSPPLGDPEALRRALEAADAIYCPDPQRSTAGIHFAKVLSALGIPPEKTKTFPNGATAMRELAASGLPRAIGCTQITEIRATPGVRVAAPLPERFELATVYTAGICRGGSHAEDAQRFLELIRNGREVRRAAGFEF